MTEGSPIDPAKKTHSSEPPSIWLALRLAWSLGWIIALPAVLFGFGGAFLDKFLSSSPLFIILGFALAAFLSGVGVVRRVREISDSKE